MAPALDLQSTKRIIELSSAQPEVFAAVGVHPTEAHNLEDHVVEELRQVCDDPRVVAIGEIGLDYHWVTDSAAQSRQRQALEKQLVLARQVARPVILHLREAADAAGGPCATDLLAILEHWVAALRAEGHPLASRPGVLHSYAGTLEDAHRGLGLGFYFGVTGPVTYKNAAARRQVIAGLPLERLLLETDSPFLAPVPHRGRRNEPAFVTHIADKIAEIQSRTLPEVASMTAANANRLFAWGDTV